MVMHSISERVQQGVEASRLEGLDDEDSLVMMRTVTSRSSSESSCPRYLISTPLSSPH